MSANDSDTKLLLHCNGADEHTTFTDNSVGGNGGAQHTATAVDNAQGDTAQKKFGTASLLLDGTGDYLSVGDHADWNFGSAAFTIDMWFRFSSITENKTYTLIEQYDDASNRWGIYYFEAANVLSFLAYNAGLLVNVAPSFTASIDKWYHIALIRGYANTATRFELLLNGVSFLSGGYGTAAGAMPDLAGDLNIGNGSVYTDDEFAGWIDEIRIVKGVARWIANFEVPPCAYPDAADEWMGKVNGVDNPSKVNGVTAANLFAGEVNGVTTYQ